MPRLDAYTLAAVLLGAAAGVVLHAQRRAAEREWELLTRWNSAVHDLNALSDEIRAPHPDGGPASIYPVDAS